MNWENQIIFKQCEHENVDASVPPSHMKPGLSGTYNKELREKASVRSSPVPPEYMGLEGEYDPTGLAKRVAKALDQQPRLSDIKTLTFVQKGNAIVFSGEIQDPEALGAIVDTASRVDGTHAVDVSRVTIADSPPL